MKNQQQQKNNHSIIYSYNTPIQITPQNNMHLLSLLTIAIHFAYAIENVFITPLMIAYSTPNIVDAFIWIIPNILAILIRPYIVTYINLLQITIVRQLPILTFLILFSGIGCLLVAYSTNYLLQTQIIIRIIISTIGWTIMDASLQLAQYIIQKMKGFLNKNFTLKDSLSEKSLQTIISVFVYISIFLFLGSSKKSSMKIFYSYCKKSYYFAGSVLIFVSILFKSLYEVPNSLNSNENLQINKNKSNFKIQNLFIKRFVSPQFFLPGFYEFRYSSFKIKMLLLVHFCIQYLSEIVLIYSTMWFYMRAQYDGLNESKSYCCGLRDGSLGLVVFTLVQHFVKGSNKNKNVFGGIIIIGAIFVCLAYLNFKMIWLYGLCICLGIVVGFYRKYILVGWQQKYGVFCVCQQLIERVSKIFVLCIMPFVSMIILQRDDIQDCILLGMIMMIGIGYFLLKSNTVDMYDNIDSKISKDGKTKFK